MGSNNQPYSYSVTSQQTSLTYFSILSFNYILNTEWWTHNIITLVPSLKAQSLVGPDVWEKYHKTSQIVLFYLADGISTPYVLFNAEIWLSTKCLLMILTIYIFNFSFQPVS